MRSQTNHIWKLSVSGLLIATGLLLPWVFHLVGGETTGTLFLPMHLPVLLGGFLLGPLFGCAVGILTPLLSGLLTGMPAAAVLPFMTVELAVYGLAAGGFYQRCRLPSLVSLLLAQLAGRLVKALVLLALTGVFGLHVPAPLTVLTAVGAGLPGLALQWVALPLLLAALRRGHLIEAPDPRQTAQAALERARAVWEREEASCVVYRQGKAKTSHLSGVRPLLGWLAEDAQALRGAAVADKVVGRAAALLLVYGGVRAVYAAVISEAALAVLQKAGVAVRYGECVPFIANRDKTDMCPMERRVQDIDDPAAAFEALCTGTE